MKDFFCTIYNWTCGLYGAKLDNYLYETVPGYLHNGLVMFISSLVFCVVFYYAFNPIRRQNFWWFMYFVFDAILNFIFAIYYTMTPLVNNEIDVEKEWTNLDCVFFGVSNIIWAFVAYLLFSLLLKWWSSCKYVPFRAF